MKLTNRFTVATAAILGLQSPFGLASDLSAHPEYLKFERYVAWGYLGTYIGREGTRTFEERGTTLQIDHKDEHSRPTMTTIFTFNTEGTAQVCRVDYKGEENIAKRQNASKNICQPLSAFMNHQIEDITTESCREAQKAKAREFLSYCLNNPYSRIMNIVIPE